MSQLRNIPNLLTPVVARLIRHFSRVTTMTCGPYIMVRIRYCRTSEHADMTGVRQDKGAVKFLREC